MTEFSKKNDLTLADYQAAEARLAAMRDAAVKGFKVAQESGDLVAGSEWMSKLSQEFADVKAFRGGIPRDVRLSMDADRILESFLIDKDNFVNLVIPADVSDEDAICALNGRSEGTGTVPVGTMIPDEHISDIVNAGKESGRRTSGPRIVKLTDCVPDTRSLPRDQQAEVLKKQGLTFSHPIDQALAALAYSCMAGRHLFPFRVNMRGSLPEFTLYTDKRGYIVVNSVPVHLNFYVGASGMPLSGVR